jgi:Macrocin-O-methyltransferase (TylF)
MLPREIEAVAKPAGLPLEGEAAAAWLLSPEAQRHGAVRRYVFFLKWMYETFHAIGECFPHENPAGEEGKDARAQATSAEEMLHLANELYLLASHEVPGAVLECGCFKGFSTCCLSHACATLGRELIVADSFQGLPPPAGGDAGWYREGDFRGTLAEVEENLKTYGRPEAVRFREGWFRDSLRGWSRPLALLWLDVDLYESAQDVLENVLQALDPRGSLASHEFRPEHILEGRIVQEQEPPGAIREALDRRRLTYRALHLAGQTALIAFGRTPESAALLNALLPHLRDADHRARAAQEAIGLKAGFKDLARRTRERLKGRPGAASS